MKSVGFKLPSDSLESRVQRPRPSSRQMPSDRRSNNIDALIIQIAVHEKGAARSKLAVGGIKIKLLGLDCSREGDYQFLNTN